MGKLILLCSVFGMLLLADVHAQGGGRLAFQRMLMMRERELAMRRAFPFGFPGSTIPPGLAARIAAASGPGVSPLLVAQLNAIGTPVLGPGITAGIGPGIGLSPLEAALLGSPELGPGITLGESVALRGPSLASGSLAATLGVDTSTLGSRGPQVASGTGASGSTPGGTGFPPTGFGSSPSGIGGPSGFPSAGFRGTPSGPGGPGFPTGSFGGSPSGPGSGFSMPTFAGARRGAGRFAPPPPFRRRFPPRPPRRRSFRGRPRPPMFIGRRRPFRDFPQIPQIPQIPAGNFQSQPTTSGTSSSTGTGPGSMTNPGSTSINAQSFPSIPSSGGAGSTVFNGRTAEFSTENSGNVIFPAQSAQAPVIAQRRPDASRFGTSRSGMSTQQFPEEPMIPQIPAIPSRQAPSRRAPNGMLQFANQGLNVRFSRLPPGFTGGRFQGGSFRGMPGGLGSQFTGTAGQPGMQAGPAFETGSDASQNMNIQFRPLPTNLQGQPGRFDPSTGLRTDTSRQVNQNQNTAVTAEGSSGQTFSIRKGQEASTSGPAEFQIVRVGSLPEFSRNMGSSVGVRMQGGEAVISGQSAAASSNKVDIVATDTAGATQADFKPVGDVNTASNAFSEVTSGTGTVADKLSKGAGASADMVVDSSVSASSVLEATGTSSSVTKDATAVTETETLKLKSPLEPVDFSFFAETTNNQPAAGGQPTVSEVVTLTEAAVIEPPAIKTEITKSEPSQPSISSNTILEFPVQGTATKMAGEAPATDFSLKVPNTNIQSGSSSAILSETVQGETGVSSISESSSNIVVEKAATVDVGTQTDLSFFQPPAVDAVQTDPNNSNIGTNPDLSFFQPPAVDGTLGDPKAASMGMDTGMAAFNPPALKTDTLQVEPNAAKVSEGTITQDVPPAV